ncbi:MAG: AAA family ATPase [bacterium]|nr:AAA family ATPase [bacterium]
MRLRKFKIVNFKGITDSCFDWEDLVAFIGENNAGKSSALQALKWFLLGSQLKDEKFFRDHITDGENAMELIGTFEDLTEDEQQSLAVRGRMHGDSWIIKKRFWADGAPGEKEWQEKYFSYSSQERFRDWPTPDNSWSAFPENYQPIIEQIPDRGTRPNQQSREALKELVRAQRRDLIEAAEPAWLENPGGGGNWKSNANSLFPRLIFIEAVHDASVEAVSREASAYGKILGLIVEKRMMQRPEVLELKARLDAVLRLFSPDPTNGNGQAEEIRDLENRINTRLNEVVGGIVSIETSEVDIRPILLPSTELMLRDKVDSVKTPVMHQGHGLQRMLIMTLLQILAEVQAEPTAENATIVPRTVILAIEEPELYMHPQMERKMRDALYRLASQDGIQVICTTHSPVFLDMGQKHKAIVRVVKDDTRSIRFLQVKADLFTGVTANDDRNRLRLVTSFHPTINEVFFARRVALLEEQSAIAAFQKGSELIGLFQRHPHLRRDVTLIDADGKGNIPLFQQVLGHFSIPYTVIYDEDQGNPMAPSANARIESLIGTGSNSAYRVGPRDLESLLGYTAGKDKVYRALQQVEKLNSAGSLPAPFLEAINWLYFGQATEPVA